MTAVSVIIPARNAQATIAETLAGLSVQDGVPKPEVIVVDDGSSDETVAIAERSPIVSEVIRQASLGPALARNAGVAASSRDVLAFIDADCVPCPRWLAEGVTALEDADFVQGAVRPAGPVGVFDRSLWVTREWGLYESANLFVRRTLFDALAGFEQWIVPRQGKELGEDVWFGWRARRAGARIVFCEQALVHHAVFARGAAGYISERLGVRFFPRMARRVPELRETLFFRRYFLSSRTAAFDLAGAGVAWASARRQAGPVLLAVPYLAMLAHDVREHPARFAIKLAAVRTVADAVTAAALLAGSLVNRTLVL